jgi:hypothetical protein
MGHRGAIDRLGVTIMEARGLLHASATKLADGFCRYHPAG